MIGKKLTSVFFLKSTQYKKLVPNALRLTYWNSKSCKSNEKNEANDIRLLFFSFSSINLGFWCCLFCFSMWFARFQILICQPQSIWRKLLALSWLYLPLGSQQLTAAKYMSLSRKTLAIDSMIFAERMQSASQGA